MGGSTRSFEIAKRFVEKGHEVNLITTLQNKKIRITKKSGQ